MPNYNPINERIKRRYFTYLKEAKRYSEATVDDVAKAIARFEVETNWRDLKTFHHEQAIAFKRRLSSQLSAVTGERLSKATLHSTFGQLKSFFQWLAGQPGYRSRIRYTDADYFSLSEKDTRVATARRDRAFPTVEQVVHVISVMPSQSDIERRNRALVAFTLLTGARDSAIASMKLKHVDLVLGCVYQDARDVNTKFSKTFTTYFFPVSDQVRTIVEEWVGYLRREKLWGNEDPLFPSTQIVLGEAKQFESAGLLRQHWSSASPIRAIFRAAFKGAGLPYFNPHSFRNTLAVLGETLCRTPEQFKAWSQNFGHESVSTTLTSYGAVTSRRQGEIISGLAHSDSENAAFRDLVKALALEIKKMA